MQATIDALQVEVAEQDVTTFLDSLEWLYLTHRYPTPAQGRLLRLLTVAGLAPTGWGRFSGQVVTMAPQTHGVRQVMNQAKVTPAHLRPAVAEIWRFAHETDILVGAPPICPVYLTTYGYTQAAYLADLYQVYGEPMLARYKSPWPAQLPQPQPTRQPPHFVHKMVAMMGTTARAIDWLVQRGTRHADENKSDE